MQSIYSSGLHYTFVRHSYYSVQPFWALTMAIESLGMLPFSEPGYAATTVASASDSVAV